MSSLHCPISLKLRICASVVEIWSLLQKNKITKNRAEWDKIRVQTLEIKQTEREPGEGGDGGGGDDGGDGGGGDGCDGGGGDGGGGGAVVMVVVDVMLAVVVTVIGWWR